MTILLLEGIDGGGKSTLLELLKKDFKFEYFKYPTSQNKKIQDYLAKKVNPSGSELVDWFLDDIFAEQEKLRKAGKKGLVIIDRYVFSTIAYEAHLLLKEEIKRRIELRGFLVPDKVILLDLPARVSYERKKKQKELDRYESDISYLETVRQYFLELYKEKYLTKNWVKIDAIKSIEEVYKELKKEIK